MMRHAVILALVAISVGGCAQKARVVSSPYADGVNHTEPVFYNGKHYSLRFKYQAQRNAYDVNIVGKGGRKLGGKPGDQKIVSEVVSSAIRHFTCARGQKAHVIPGTPRHDGGAWDMQARCT